MKNKRTKSRLTQRQIISIIRLNDSSKKEYFKELALYKEAQIVIDNLFGFPIFGFSSSSLDYRCFVPVPIRTILSRKCFK